MVEHQGPRRHAQCQIIVHGMQDVTSKLNPYLISVQVTNNIEQAQSVCNIELDDRNAELQIPPNGVRLQVAMGWAGEGPRLIDYGRQSKVGGQGEMVMTKEEIEQERKFGGPGMELIFSGWVSNVESGFGRKGGGRRLWVEGTSGNVAGKIKQQQKATMGEGKPDDSQEKGIPVPMMSVMSKVFGFAGLKASLSPEMMKIERDFWNVNDSAMNFGQRIANEVGGVFAINGNVATILGRNEGVNGAGLKLPTVEAIWGINLIGWRIKPYAGRAEYGEAGATMFNINNAVHETVKGAISGGGPFGGSGATAHAVQQVADKVQGEQSNAGKGEHSKGERGKGWILLNGEPRAMAGSHVVIDGARPGVDGKYLITEAEHNYTRGVGYTTRCNVQYPVPKIGGYAWDAEKRYREQAQKRADEAKAAVARDRENELAKEVDKLLEPTDAAKKAELDRQEKEAEFAKDIQDMLDGIK